MIGIGGFGGFSAPDEILCEMAKSFSAHGSPKGLHVVSGVSPGDVTVLMVWLAKREYAGASSAPAATP